jgi:predicted RecA/RadA family phage recombinase
MARSEANVKIGHKNFESVQYANSSAVSAGEVIELDATLKLIGVAHSDYDAGAEGVYYVKGTFQLPIADGVTVSQFAVCYWDQSASKVVTTDTGADDIPVGYAVAAGTAAGGYVDVAINEGFAKA